MTVYIRSPQNPPRNEEEEQKKKNRNDACNEQPMRLPARTPFHLSLYLYLKLSVRLLFGKLLMLAIMFLPEGASFVNTSAASLSSAPADNTARLTNRTHWNFRRISFVLQQTTWHNIRNKLVLSISLVLRRKKNNNKEKRLLYVLKLPI